MGSSFQRIRPATGGGRKSSDGHKDAVIHVLQTDDDGFTLYPEIERDNTTSITSAAARAIPPENLFLDTISTEPYGTAPSAVLWVFEYSNDKFYDLSGLSIEDALPSGAFGQSTSDVRREFPALIRRDVPIFGINSQQVSTIPLYTEFVLNTLPEQLVTWQVKTTTNQWNFATATDIAARVNTIHLINGNYYQFAGAISVDKIDDENYEVVYEWVIDPGTLNLSVRSDQDPDSYLILPPIIQSGDPALVMPFGDGFDAGTYLRLPYHEVVIGVADLPVNQPPFLQVVTTNFNVNFALDWQLLPGDPVNAV